jgi:DNA polymerase-3 subunit epsilon
MSTTLSNLDILALDCQATGANPARGHLLEIGWTRTRASSDNPAKNPAARSYLVGLPAGAAIPRAVQRITGISDEMMKTSVSAETAWQYLLAAAGMAASAHPRNGCPVVIHFARFEAPFLRMLHRSMGPAGPFPFQIICTHEIAVRLLPDLPRRGLRAIAGFYGHCMPELKRSADHAAATAFIWQRMVQLLDKNCAISRLEQLSDWLAATRPAGRSKRAFPMNPQIRQQLPDTPGVYRMLRTGGEPLYIGKAKSLRQRVNSYFRRKARHAEHILEMLTQARKLDVTRTGSALEAALLESDEIKRHSPPYNIALRRRQRQLVFCSKDLTRHAPLADKDHPVGPLPAGKTIEALTALGLWLGDAMLPAGGPDSTRGCSILALPPEYAPQCDCLMEGFEIFRQQYGGRLDNQTPLRFLTGLGAKLWQAKLDAAATAQAAAPAEKPADMDDLDAQPQDPDSTPTWTPETVARAIEATVRHSAHLIRRARWFCLLSESSVTWASADRTAPHKNQVVFENGAVVKPGAAKIAAGTGPAAGYRNSFRRRQNNVDLITYDRLRVFTTEIRRIITEGRQIELRLGPKVSLGRSELIKALKWV